MGFPTKLEPLFGSYTSDPVIYLTEIRDDADAAVDYVPEDGGDDDEEIDDEDEEEVVRF